MWIWLGFLLCGVCLILGLLIIALQCATARLTDQMPEPERDSHRRPIW